VQIQYPDAVKFMGKKMPHFGADLGTFDNEADTF
jgi:hypothetical protein